VTRGGVAWLTGMSGAGKSTLAMAVAARLAPRRPVEILDGDAIRAALWPDLGFSRADRDANVERIAYVARLLAGHGVLVLVAAIAPTAATRAAVRARSIAAVHAFLEIFVRAELDVLIARDPKGLYARAQRGELAGLTGVSDPYEAPVAPALELRTDRETPDACAALLVALLEREGLG